MSGEVGETASSRIYTACDLPEGELHPIGLGLAAVFTRRAPESPDYNEDSCAIIPYDERSGLLVVADGAGGLPSGAKASELAVNAMRAGVLSRFMGIIGIIVGVLFVIPLLGQVPIVEVFWVAALGLLFLGRWPQGGRGPAWETGEAIPWPTAQDRAAAMAEKRADRELDRDETPEPVAAGGRRPAPEEEPDGDRPVTDQHPRSKKRKRKRR